MTSITNFSRNGHGRLRLSVRPASVADSAEISDICLQSLLTSDSSISISSNTKSTGKGRRAGSHHSRKVARHVQHPILPAEVRALPYLHLPSGFGFVLVESREDNQKVPRSHFSMSDSSSDESEKSSSPYLGASTKKYVHWELESDISDMDISISSDFSMSSSSSSSSSSFSHSSSSSISSTSDSVSTGSSNNDERIVGYVVGTLYPSQFMREADATWWPALRLQYPEGLAGTPLDRHFIGLVHRSSGNCKCESSKLAGTCEQCGEKDGFRKKSFSTSRHPGSTSFGPGQIHLGVIGKYKEHGCDRLLVDVAMRYLKRRSKGQETGHSLL